MKKVLRALLFYVLLPFTASIPFLFLDLFLSEPWISAFGVPIVTVLLYFLFRKKLDFGSGLVVNGIALVVLPLIFTVMMAVSKGAVEGVVMMNFLWFIFPFAPIMLVAVLMDASVAVYIAALLTYGAAFLYCLYKTGFSLKKLSVPFVCVLVCLLISGHLYGNRPAVKYGGHGFQYMHGFSSTDFTDYTVYAEHSKLAVLDHEPSFFIENADEMPVLDGAEACYPLYAAFAKAVYRDIDRIEKQYLSEEDPYFNGEIVTFTNTILGFDRLFIGGKDMEKRGEAVDLFFGARPSADQLNMAREYGVELEITPIGREAFVFFVEEDNPISSLTADEVRAIYHGDIVNWKELGGKDQEIVAFQRPNNSGSQTMMAYFMGDVKLKEPQTYETVDAMMGVIHEVAQYANDDGAIGYSFRYFLEGLSQEKGVKILSIDGVSPTLETIESGAYPLTVDLCMITRKDDPNPNVEKMREFILSEDGQELVRKTGYAGLN